MVYHARRCDLVSGYPAPPDMPPGTPEDIYIAPLSICTATSGGDPPCRGPEGLRTIVYNGYKYQVTPNDPYGFSDTPSCPCINVPRLFSLSELPPGTVQALVYECQPRNQPCGPGPGLGACYQSSGPGRVSCSTTTYADCPSGLWFEDSPCPAEGMGCCYTLDGRHYFLNESDCLSHPLYDYWAGGYFCGDSDTFGCCILTDGTRFIEREQECTWNPLYFRWRRDMWCGDPPPPGPCFTPPGPPPPPPGMGCCYLVGGERSVTTEADCLANSDFLAWAGGEPCPPPPPPPPPPGQGACCLPNGSCFLASESECIGQGGKWHEAQTCFTVSCGGGGAPTGACRTLTGGCFTLTEADCLARGDALSWTEGESCRGGSQPLRAADIPSIFARFAPRGGG